MSDWDLTPQQRAECARALDDAVDPYKDFTRPLLKDGAGRVFQGRASAPSAQPLSGAEYERLTYPEKVAYAAAMGARR
jgi:hypothetical protein